MALYYVLQHIAYAMPTVFKNTACEKVLCCIMVYYEQFLNRL